MENSTLPALVNQYNWLMQEIIKADGELNQELEIFFQEVSANLQAKADAYKFILDRLESDAEFWAKEVRAASNAKQVCYRIRERLKSTMKLAMQEMRLDSVQGNAVRFTLSDAAPTLDIIDLDAVPKELIIEKVEVIRQIDREKCLAILKAGGEIPGLRLQPVKTLRASKKRRD